MEKEDVDTISAMEIDLAFPKGQDILEIVGKWTAPQPPPPFSTSLIGREAAPLRAEEGTLKAEATIGGKKSPYKLPLLDEGYRGREEEAAAIASLLTRQINAASSEGSKVSPPLLGAVCLVAGAGMGKSCLAIDVGRRLFKAGLCPGARGKEDNPNDGPSCTCPHFRSRRGPVDLREAVSALQVLERFCVALNKGMVGVALNG